MYRRVEFKSQYVDDWEFDENGDPITPGYRNVAEKIAAQLAHNLSHITAVVQHSYYGWAFETCRFYQVLGTAGNDGQCCLTIQCLGYWLRKLLFKKPRLTFVRYCEAVDEAIQRIPETSALRWDDFTN